MGKRNETKARMLAATAHLLLTQGFNGTGMKQIVTESGTPWGSLYFHFPGGKEQLAAEAIRVAGERTAEAIRGFLGSSGDIATAIEAYAESAGTTLLATGFTEGCPVATVALEAAANSEPIRSACDDAFSAWWNLLAEGLRAAGAEPPDADELATLVLSAIEGALIISRARKDTNALEAVVRRLEPLVRAACTSERT
jgi:TetR/AcrR family transcriptional repressor of lmrAB and yxaGH operons